MGNKLEQVNQKTAMSSKNWLWYIMVENFHEYQRYYNSLPVKTQDKIIEEIGDGYIFANELVAQDWYYNNEYKFGKMKEVKDVVIELMSSNTYGIGDIITEEDKKLEEEKLEEKRM